MAREWLRNHRSFIAAALTLMALAIVLSLFAAYDERFPGDERLMEQVKAIRLPYFDGLMHLVTYLGNLVPAAIQAILAVALLWFLSRRLEAVFVALSLSGQILSWTIKSLVRRPRPPIDLLNDLSPESSSSFPSGHVIHFVVFFGFLMYLAHNSVGSRPLRIIIYSIGGGLIVLVGLSRVYVGAHWPSDLLGGYVIGALWLLILVRAYQATRKRY